MHVAMSVGGFDPTSGAGVTRDIITFRKIGIYGVGVVTAVTYQSTSKVYGMAPLNPQDVERQVNALMEDFEIKYVKVGVVATEENARLIAKKIDEFGFVAVVDPILASSSGYSFIASPRELENLLKKAEVITPNAPEAEILSGIKIKDERSVIDAGKAIEKKYGTKVIIKGGHLDGTDYLFMDGDVLKEKIDYYGKDLHGTGCAYSSALTAHMALGYSLPKSFRLAREFLESEIRNSIKIASRELLP